MTIKTLFRNTAFPRVNYDFTDVTTGAGYIEYKAYVTLDASGEVSKMSTITQSSASKIAGTRIKEYLESEGSFTTTEGTVNRTFESDTYNQPITIEGTFLATIPWSSNFSAGDQVADFWFTVTFYTNDGTSDTQIATVTTTKESSVAGSGLGGTRTVPLELPKTDVKIGWTIKVLVTLHGQRTSGSAGTQYVYLAHDPLNRDGKAFTPSSAAGTTTIMKFGLPVRIIE